MLILAAGWAGGFTCQWFFPARTAEAAGRILQADQLWVYAKDGKHRIQMGTYAAGSEQGQPLLGLSDSQQRIRLLLRLAGPNETPVMIFKDKDGNDRLVLGLNHSGGDESPLSR